jgi:hypothetical protein
MTVREWNVKLDTPHTVRVEHSSAISGKVVVILDGKEIYRRGGKLWDAGMEHRFSIDGKPCILRILDRTWRWEYKLWADRKLQ